MATKTLLTMYWLSTWLMIPRPLTSSSSTSSNLHKIWPKRNWPRCRKSVTKSICHAPLKKKKLLNPKTESIKSMVLIGGITPKNSARPSTTSTRITSSPTSLLTMYATACLWLPISCTASPSHKTPTCPSTILAWRPTK